MPLAAEQIVPMDSGEVLLAGVDFQGFLRDGVLLTGTPTVTIDPSASGPTLSSKQVNTAEIRINEQDVPIGKAVTYLITGASATSRRYLITITVSTTDGQTLKANQNLQIL